MNVDPQPGALRTLMSPPSWVTIERTGFRARTTVGKGRVIYTELDVTTGLLGTNTWGITGYSPAYAQGLLKNLILDASTRPSTMP